MTPERWRRVDSLFTRCAGLDCHARQAVLDTECATDPALRRLVEGMLAADASAEDRLRTLIGESAGLVDVAAAPQWQGRMLGAYRIEREIGAGGMGTVFLASRADEAYERRVAIKVLSNVFASADERRRFLAERQILADLAHPNIAQLLDGGTTAEGTPYLVMEYIEGVPIDRYCTDAQLTLEERLHLFLRVCGAVQFAHQRLVIHRDIKPGNILVTADGTPKLLDFGIAKLLDTTAATGTIAQTLLGARLLTPQHASPEQIRGEPVTTASDVYSLGVLLFRLLTGRYPHEPPHAGPAAMERAILEEPAQRPSVAAGEHRRRLAGDLDNIVLQALRKDPERRYATVRELAHDLECFLAQRPVAARADSAGYRLRKFIGRHRAGVVAGAAAIATLIALVGFHTVRLAHERDLQARERATAERVSQFMVDIFRVADPWSGRPEVTARELLDQAYEGIDRELADQPLTAAKLRVAMGRAYGGLAMYGRAVELEREALELRRANLPADDPAVAEALHYLGSMQAESGNYAAAREDLEAALAMRSRQPGTATLPLGETLTRLAFVQMREGDYPAMRASLERALAIHLEAVGPDHRLTADVHALQSAYHWMVGELAPAQQAAQRALAIEERQPQPDQLRLAGFLHSLGLLAWQRGEHARAIGLYERELALREQRLGPEHPSLALALYGLGNSNANLGRYEQSFACFRRAAALQEKALGPDSHYLAMTLGGYGFALLGHGDHAAAREALTRSLAIFEANFGPEHPDLRAPLAGLAKIDIAEHHYARARARLGRALRIVEAKFTPDHPDVLRTRVSLADAYRAEGRHAEALALYEPSVTAFARTLGLDHPYAADALCGMADALAQLGQYPRAVQTYGQAEANFAARQAAQLASARECLGRYAALQRSQPARAASVKLPPT